MTARTRHDPSDRRSAECSLSPADEGSDLDARIERAVAARDRVRAGWSSQAIIEAVADTCAGWRDRTEPRRGPVVEQLAEALRTPRELLDSGIDLLFEQVDAGSLDRLLATEAEDPGALDAPKVLADGRTVRLAGPPVVLHLLAGNVPGLAIAPLVCSLLARSASVVRDSQRQPLLTRAFVDSLAERAPELAEMIVVTSWQRDDDGRLAQLARRVDRAEVYGSRTTVDLLGTALAAVRAGPAVVERGPRTSVGLVPAAVGSDRSAAWAAGFARDLCLFEGRGCLTPHTIVVEGDRSRAESVVDAMAEALAEAQRRWPRQPQTLELEAARRAFLDRAEIRSLTDPSGRLVRGAGDAWSVHLSGDEPPTVGPGLRCVAVASCRDRQNALDLIATCDPPLAAVGIAGLEELPGGESAALHDRLSALGATLVCAAGRMQAPPLAWSQDGRRRLADLLSWQEAAR